MATTMAYVAGVVNGARPVAGLPSGELRTQRFQPVRGISGPEWSPDGAQALLQRSETETGSSDIRGS